MVSQAENGQRVLQDTRMFPAARGVLTAPEMTVLVVDDSKLYREYLAGVIAANAAARPTMAWDLDSLTAALHDSAPMVILLNVATRNSAVLLRRMFSSAPGAQVIAMGMSEDDEPEIVACAEAGVAGYHLRNESLEDLLILIRKVAAGESACSPAVSAILLRRLSALAAQRQGGAEELVLTSRETQILRMLEAGASNREIAETLCIAVHTVKNHVHNLLTKLGVSSRAQAAAISRTIPRREA
ncbi:response regulator transcription factor [Mycolicibacterium flavescens]|uniref:response regulator transcription factor n=1 Tax=Mycolicibacterium flavescens TaxID=1776 RepID=UPI000AB58B55|nr:response regulator transcription factor [Mycolicibacterium flavescens]